MSLCDNSNFALSGLEGCFLLQVQFYNDSIDLQIKCPTHSYVPWYLHTLKSDTLTVTKFWLSTHLELGVLTQSEPINLVDFLLRIKGNEMLTLFSMYSFRLTDSRKAQHSLLTFLFPSKPARRFGGVTIGTSSPLCWRCFWIVFATSILPARSGKVSTQYTVLIFAQATKNLSCREYKVLGDDTCGSSWQESPGSSGVCSWHTCH